MSNTPPKKRVRATDKEFTFNDYNAWKAAATMMRNRDDLEFIDEGEFISFAFEPSKQNPLPDDDIGELNKVGFFNKQRNFGYVDAIES